MMIDRLFISRQYIRGSGIEIGAFHNPFPINPQMKVTYVDRYPYEDLAIRRDGDYTIQGKTITRVDVVDDGMYLKSFADESQDFVLSSHHLEHCWNPLGTIENHLRVLKPGGKIFYAVPDKRFTFDNKRPNSSSDDILNVYCGGQVNEILMDQYQEYLNRVDNIEISKALEMAEKSSDLRSLDIHWFCWDAVSLASMFTSAPFNEEFDIDIFSRAGHENFVVLRKL